MEGGILWYTKDSFQKDLPEHSKLKLVHHTNLSPLKLSKPGFPPNNVSLWSLVLQSWHRRNTWALLLLLWNSWETLSFLAQPFGSHPNHSFVLETCFGFQNLWAPCKELVSCWHQHRCPPSWIYDACGLVLSVVTALVILWQIFSLFLLSLIAVKIKKNMLKFLLIVNKQGHTRTSQYYELIELEERTNLEAEIIRKCLTRNDNLVKV